LIIKEAKRKKKNHIINEFIEDGGHHLPPANKRLNIAILGGASFE
jgi:hypothetical protein